MQQTDTHLVAMLECPEWQGKSNAVCSMSKLEIAGRNSNATLCRNELSLLLVACEENAANWFSNAASTYGPILSGFRDFVSRVRLCLLNDTHSTRSTSIRLSFQCFADDGSALVISVTLPKEDAFHFPISRVCFIR